MKLLLFIFLLSTHLYFAQVILDSTHIQLNNKDLQNNNCSNKSLNLITFWASWCTPCIKSIKEIYNKNESFPQVQFYFINPYDDDIIFDEFMNKYSSKNIKFLKDNNFYYKKVFEVDMMGSCIVLNNNNLVWRGFSNELVDEFLENLNNNMIFGVKSGNNVIEYNSINVQFYLKISNNFNKNRSVTSISENKLLFENINLETILSYLKNEKDSMNVFSSDIYFDFYLNYKNDNKNLAKNEVQGVIINFFNKEKQNNEFNYRNTFLKSIYYFD